MLKRSAQSISLLATVVFSASASAQPPGNGRADYWHHGWDWGHTFFGSSMMLLLIGGIIFLVVLAVRSGIGTTRAASSSGQTALDTLDERYARSEIDKSEYDERKRTLTG